jgi:hypothetical protein
LSRGSVDVHTAQSQVSVGMPALVPEPSTVILMVALAAGVSLVLEKESGIYGCVSAGAALSRVAFSDTALAWASVACT